MLMKTMILPLKVATGTAYACLRPIKRSPSSGDHARSKKVPGLRMFPYVFLLRELKLHSCNFKKIHRIFLSYAWQLKKIHQKISSVSSG